MHADPGRWRSCGAASATAGPVSKTQPDIRSTIASAEAPEVLLQLWADHKRSFRAEHVIAAICRIAKISGAEARGRGASFIDDSGFHALLDAATELVIKFQASQLAAVSFAVAKTGAAVEGRGCGIGLLRAIGDVIVASGRGAQFDNRGLANIAWAFATAALEHPALLREVAGLAAASMHDFNEQDFATTAWAYASPVGFCGRELVMRAVARYTATKAPDMNALNLANLASAFAKVDIMTCIGEGGEDLQGDGFGGEGGNALRAVAAHSAIAIDSFRPAQLANTIWAFAKLGLRHEPLLLAAAVRVREKASDFNARDVSSMAWSFAKLDVREECLFRALSEQAVGCIERFDSQGIANLVWGIATVGVRHEQLLDEVATAMATRTAEFSAQGLVNVACSFGVLEARGSAAFTVALEAIAHEASTRQDEFTARGLADLSWALTAAGLSHAVGAQSIAEAAASHIGEMYQHRYHAGGPIDCFKHVTVAAALLALRRGEAGDGAHLHYVDTHSGAGVYDLLSVEAQRSPEFLDGVARLSDASIASPAITAFIDAQRACGAALQSPLVPHDELSRGDAVTGGGGGGRHGDGGAAQDGGATVAPGGRYYAGSPAVAMHLLRSEDEATLFESSPPVIDALRRGVGSLLQFRGEDMEASHYTCGVQVRAEDSFTALQGDMTEFFGSRGLVFVDPPYQRAFTQQQTLTLVRRLLDQWPSCCIMVWYPIVDAALNFRFYEALRSLYAPGVAEGDDATENMDGAAAVSVVEILAAEFALEQPEGQGQPLARSGVVVVRPPAGLEEMLRAELPLLAEALEPPGGRAQWSLRRLAPEAAEAAEAAAA